MAVQKPSIPKGTRDFSPEQVAKRKYILNTIEKVFIKYGFMPIETPTMENLSTLEGKYGDEGDKLLFRVLDSGDYWGDLSKDLMYLYESLRQVTKAIFIQGMISDDYAKHPTSLRNFLEENYKSICFSSNIFGLLYKNSSDQNNVIESFYSKLDLIGFELCRFFNEAHLYKGQNEEEIDFHFQQFIINNFSEIFNYKFITDSTTEKGLRYDLTVPFARYVVMHQNEITFPFKRYQMQPVWRADRPQKGRYREFWQCDADVVGSDSLLNELDLIQIYDEAFKKLKIENYELRINNRKILSGIAEVVKGVEHMNTIAVVIDKLDKIGKEGVGKELLQSGFSENEIQKLFEIISIKGDNRSKLLSLKEKLISSQEGLKGIEELEFILNSTNQSTVTSSEVEKQPINLKIDFSLARGLSYYTGCIFEVVSTEGTLKSSIGGGGRYDNLTGIFGLLNVSGVGISFGLDRIYDVMEELNLFPKTIKSSNTKILFCCFDNASQQYALRCLKKLRDTNIPSEIYPDIKKVGKQLDYANALKIPFACIIGDNEMQTGKLVLKDLNSGTQEELSIEEIIAKIN